MLSTSCCFVNRGVTLWIGSSSVYVSHRLNVPVFFIYFCSPYPGKLSLTSITERPTDACVTKIVLYNIEVFLISKPFVLEICIPCANSRGRTQITDSMPTLPSSLTTWKRGAISAPSLIFWIQSKPEAVSASLCLVLDNQATSLWESLERQGISNHVH